jgi:hypothetical protein
MKYGNNAKICIQACIRGVLFAFLLWGQPSWADRPYSSENASTVDYGECQIEAWLEGTSEEKSANLVPACGVLPGVEMALGLAKSRPGGDSAAELGLKWAPESWQIPGTGGSVRVGLKFTAAASRNAGAEWQSERNTFLGMASWQISDRLFLHGNLGASRHKPSGQTAQVWNLAVGWQASSQHEIFLESLNNNRPQTFGDNTWVGGVRWWLQPEKLGLDLTLRCRRDESSCRNSRDSAWSLGVGWYGLQLK